MIDKIINIYNIRFGAILGIILVCALFLIGCATTENVRIIEQVLPYEDGELRITATILSEDELTTRYGRNNPFIAPSRLLTSFDFLAIELSVTMPDDFGIIPLEQIMLDFSTYRGTPRTIVRMLRLWENEIEVHGPDVVNSRWQRLIRTFMIGSDIATTRTGLLIFRGNFPYVGNAILSVPHPNTEASEITELATRNDIEETYLEPLCECKNIYFNFAIENEQVPRSFF